MPVNITGLFSYPIKSCGALSHDSITVTELGLEHDRQWMLVDAEGLFISQRKHPGMALIQPRITGQQLTVEAPGMSVLDIPDAAGQTVDVQVWKDQLTAAEGPEHINQWFSDYLHTPVRLVHHASHSERLIDTAFAKAGEQVAFADGYPILITHQASLDALNARLSAAVGMERFRPNVVVKTDQAAWTELHWQQLSHQDGTLDLVKPCTRCVMTGVDQHTGTQTGSEVLKTLRTTFAHQDQAVFGINAIPRMHKGGMTLRRSDSLQLQ
jgi:uncharacterized protein YcbX